MDATFNLTKGKVRTMNQYHNNVSRAMIHINDIKYDLLKIAEMYDGVLQDGLGHLAADMFQNYLSDLRADEWIHDYEVSNIVLKEQSFTYDVSIQITRDRTPKKLKIHVGLYKSAWPDVAPSLKYNKETGYHAQ
jgi:hypothetical protein